MLRRLAVALCLAVVACDKGQRDPAPAAAATQASAPAPFDLSRIDKARQMGADSARVWLVMASDFECPYCRAFHDETWPRIEREYVRTGKIRVAFMNYPMSMRQPMHPRAEIAAEAAMCAGAQDKFWAMHDSLFDNQARWTKGDDPHAVFESFARALGLQLDAWRNCQATHASRPTIVADFTRMTQVGVDGTPSFVVGDSLAVIGAAPFGEFQRAIDAALAKAGR